MKVPRRGFVALMLLLTASFAAAELSANTQLFPRPASLEPAVQFWTRVYTEVDTRSGFIHDNLRMDVVYETVRFGGNETPQQQSREIERRIIAYRQMLERLAAGGRGNLSAEERRVLALFPADVSAGELRGAAGRIRFQLGQADRFRAGLIRSGAWKPYIEKVLEERGLPPELAVLPHVESSYDPTAYSRVGAAGMWQFMPSTAVRYMRIDHVVDERRDPFLSTHGAAQLLADNHAVLGTWPLAITAYNHGAGGMRRAVAQLGTTDIATIVRAYDGRTFGFASRNFYAAFLAALEVDTHAERYFGRLSPHRPADASVISMPSYMSAATVAEALGIGEQALREHNPALLDVVWRAEKYVPQGFPLRVPSGPATDAATLLARVPPTHAFAAQLPDVEHRVRSGDTLSGIAQRYGVSVNALMAANRLRSRDFIRAGQLLILPVPPGSAQAVLARAEEAPAEPARVTLVANAQSEPETAVAVAAVAQDDPAAGRPAETAPTAEAEFDAELAAAIDAPALPEAAPEEAGDGAEVNAADADAADTNALASIQAELAADPSDYSVAADHSIEVQVLETLGHYADWLGLRTQRLRELNGLPFQRAVVIGQRIRLDFSNVDPAAFEQRRTAYHRALQEAFFAHYRIEDIEAHVVRSGESLWALAQQRYKVPVWLLRQYNPDLELDRVQPGTVVNFPRLKALAEGQTQV
jgi:membrane-bound lytic murein transglycosylase D